MLASTQPSEMHGTTLHTRLRTRFLAHMRVPSHPLVTLFVLSCLLCPSNALASNGTRNSTTNSTVNLEPLKRELVAIRESVKCYALPYGAIGCASHVLTYYCLVVNALGRKPLMPWKFQQCNWLNVIIGILQLAGSCVASALAISRCKGRKEMQLLGIWMILTSIAAGIASTLGHGRWIGATKKQDPAALSSHNLLYGQQPTAPATTNSFQMKPYQGYEAVPLPERYHQHGSYHESEVVEEQEEPKRPKRKFFSMPGKKDTDEGDEERHNNDGWGIWMSWGLIGAVWLAGCAMGAYGSVLIALKVFLVADHVWKVTAGFFALPVLVLVIWALSFVTASKWKDIKESFSLLRFAIKICLLFLVASLFYMDWLLAAVTDNWWGVPKDLGKDGNILYWAYFGIKRLAFFSS